MQNPEAKTRKKVKVIGVEEYINPSTGEIKEMQVVSVEERDFNFTKVWMRDFLSKLDSIGNVKTHIAYWVIDHINRDNQLIYTQRQIADETGYSLKTVASTMKILQEAGLLRQRNAGCYVINPNTVFKGTQQARLNVLTEYQALGQPEKPKPSKEEQLKNILKSIETLTKQANRLSEELKANEADPDEALQGMDREDLIEETA